jgi:uncharacterized protein YfaS (alpha-2-macroglobulin family)
MSAVRIPFLVVVVALSCSRPSFAEEEASKLYDLVAQAPAKLAKGDKGSVSVKITTKGEGTLHSDTPYKLTLTAPKNVALSKDKLTTADMKLAERTASFDVPFTASEAGDGKIEGRLTFFVCTEKLCSRQERSVSMPVSVH